MFEKVACLFFVYSTIYDYKEEIRKKKVFKQVLMSYVFS